MLAQIHTAALRGVEAFGVRAEVALGRGLPAFTVVGLPQGAVREGKERVRAALGAVGFPLPPRRITVNLAPADVRKEGSAFDLPVAVGLLVAAGVVDVRAAEGILFVGELGLGGALRPVRGALAVAAYCRGAGISRLVVPQENAQEAAVVEGVEVLPAASLRDVRGHLEGSAALRAVPPPSWRGEEASGAPPPDLADVRGQEGARRALEVAAAGGHNLLLVGPPGSGKTLLARRLPGILPELCLDEALEVTRVHSVAGTLPPGASLVRRRPFRAPHHTVSRAGLVGGGTPLRPGEVSLAHRGVLFLDEMAEFPRHVLEVLRQPMEDGSVRLARAGGVVSFPARFMLVGATNPCPCGHLGDGSDRCLCDPGAIARYRARISGPLRDRIGLHVEVPAPSFDALHAPRDPESSRAVRRRVAEARRRQRGRSGADGRVNADLTPPEVRRWCVPDPEGAALLRTATARLGLSARAVHRTLRVARTIADLDGSAGVAACHVAEALGYRHAPPT